MRTKLNAKLHAELVAALNTPPPALETIGKVLVKHINGVKVVLQETEMTFSMN